MAGTKPRLRGPGSTAAVPLAEALADLTPQQITELRAAASLITNTFGSSAGDAVQGPLPAPEPPAVPVPEPPVRSPARVPAPRKATARMRKRGSAEPGPPEVPSGPKPVISWVPPPTHKVAMHVGALLKIFDESPLPAAVNSDPVKAVDAVVRLVVLRKHINNLLNLYAKQGAERAALGEDKPPRAHAA